LRNTKSLAKHIRTYHNLNSKKYYDRFLKEKDEGVCLNYGKFEFCKGKTNFWCFSKGYHAYCSQKCVSNSDQVRLVRSECKLGDKHWLRKEDSIHPLEGKTYEEAYGVEKARKLKKLLSRYLTEHMLNGGAAYRNSLIKNPSKPQVHLYKLVKNQYTKVELNYPVLNYSIDIALPVEKIAIEYDGSYWHQNEEADRKRQNKIESLGWKFLRYVDYLPSKDELKADLNKVIRI